MYLQFLMIFRTKSNYNYINKYGLSTTKKEKYLPTVDKPDIEVQFAR